MMLLKVKKIEFNTNLIARRNLDLEMLQCLEM